LRKKNNSSVGVLLVFIVIIAAALYVYFSATFERNAPIITLENNNGYWNLKKPLKVKISDASGIESYKIILHTKEGDKTLEYEKLLDPKNALSLEVEPPRGSYTFKDKKLQLIIEAKDTSKWNFFKGNLAKVAFKLKIDRKRPNVAIVNNSYKISRGGSALVIFRVEDPNLKDVYILSNHNKHFQAEPFYKEGYYVALLAWPVTDSGFRANVIATDLAGNKTKTYVPLYLKNKAYKVSKIKISDKFLDGKIAELAEEFDETQGVTNKLEQFKIINEDVRAKNEKLIHKITSVVPQEMISSFHMRRMYPLKNGAVVAHFGDHRMYYYHGKLISQAYHLGLDLASHSMAPIKTQNGGKVVFANFNGLYGNMLALSHGLGLYTIYGHCSSFDVAQGEDVAPNSKIANTGKTGYAMGDHLHFGVLVQGIEVRPQEWMDRKWIKLNISDIIKKAKKIIDQQ
jgi:murein DD-endopeptidase MepM/ murein hydrolase activator NlpD